MGDSGNSCDGADLQRGIFRIVVFGTGIDSDFGSTVSGEAVPGLAQLGTIQSSSIRKMSLRGLLFAH